MRLTQRQLGSKEHGLSGSLIAQIETKARREKRVHTLERDKVWYLIERLHIWPPDCDEFLEAAGLSPDRTPEEEMRIQSQFIFDELWVFARHMLELDNAWFKVVRANIVRGISHRYFTEDETSFLKLVQRLEAGGVSAEALRERLECTLVPRDFFTANFAIYVKDGMAKYCCGTKAQDGKAARFYAVHSSDASRLYEMLQRWRLRLDTGKPVPLAPLRRTYPAECTVSFQCQ